VEAGLTAIDPDAATTPMPLLIVTVEAYAVVHDNIAELPGGTVAGEAVIVAVGTTGDIAGSNPAPRQPDMSPTQIQAVTRIKRFMAKYTLHHPYMYVTVLASKKQNQRKERKNQIIYQPTHCDSRGLSWFAIWMANVPSEMPKGPRKRSSSGSQNRGTRGSWLQWPHNGIHQRWRSR
jgi:hypothetical protein